MISRCLMCGKTVVASTSRRRDGRGRFCSRQCAGRYRVGRKAGRWTHGRRARSERRCAKCGLTFVGRSTARFCSVACAKRPKTELTCSQCGSRFVAPRLNRQYCSWECANRAKRVAERKPRLQATPEARRAQGMVRYQVQIGNIVRPDTCEECGVSGQNIEAAHFDYAEPLKVRWLCVSCHRKWDMQHPKGGTTATNTDAEEKAREVRAAEEVEA